MKGFLREFEKTARDSAAVLNQLQQYAIPLVGVDPSLVLCYRDEYRQILGEERGLFEVKLVHEWLQTVTTPDLSIKDGATEFALFGHCSEKTALPTSEQQWQSIFASFGLSLKPIAVGCCGMAGTYGHETTNVENSKALYDMSWSEAIDKLAPEQILATGYSCRSQIKRCSETVPRHPLQALLKALTGD